MDVDLETRLPILILSHDPVLPIATIVLDMNIKSIVIVCTDLFETLIIISLKGGRRVVSHKLT